MAIKIPRGWQELWLTLDSDLQRIAPGLRVDDAMNSGGTLFVVFNHEDLDRNTLALVNARLAKAEAVAQETCVACGAYGRLCYKGRKISVYCDDHISDWTAL